MRRIHLLSSYPKSGNTWIRIFLNILDRADGTADINKINIPNLADRGVIEKLLGVRTADLTLSELRRIRFDILSAVEEDVSFERVYLKVHDCWRRRCDEAPFISSNGIDSVLYVVRDPRDVAVSFSRHLGVSLDRAIDFMGNRDFCLAHLGGVVHNQIPQCLSSWSEHVFSWLEVSPFRRCMVRYEDLLMNSKETFSKIVRFLNIEVPMEAVEEAIAATSFASLQAQEERGGFRERPRSARRFFVSGVSGGWRHYFSAEQNRRILDQHGLVMQALGYDVCAPL